MTPVKKQFFSYNDIHRTVKSLADRIQAASYKPDLIVAIGSGGFIPGRIMKTYLNLPVYTVGVSLYNEKNEASEEPKKIQWIDEVERKLQGKRILLVDEVDDSRKTLAYCVKELFNHKPAAVAVAVLHCKMKNKLAEFPAALHTYWAGQEVPDDWLVYPWDLYDIDAPAKGTAKDQVKIDPEVLENSDVLALNFGPEGKNLLPVVTQDAASKEVLIISSVNKEALDESLKSGYACYWSKSRNLLWKKGESSGNRLKLVDVRVNCEQNSLLFLVEQEGDGACHVKNPSGKAWTSCFYRRLTENGTLEFLKKN